MLIIETGKMKDRLLLWIEGPLHFCLAYYLHKMFDCELYAIIDITNKPKKFFVDQNLVKFNKIWFYHDHIKKTHTPDLEYLSSFERKFNINIWKLAINERIFYRFYDFHRFSSDEILSIQEDTCKLFEKVFDEAQPDFILTYSPNLHHIKLFYELSRKRGIKSLILSNPKLGYKSRISEVPNILDPNAKFNEIKILGRDFKAMRDYRNSFNISKQIKTSLERDANSNSKLIKAAFEFLFASDNKHEKTHYTYFGRTKWRVLTYMLTISIKKKLREKFMQKNLLLDVDLKKPFVYFPLGVEPEANILITAPFFTNQIEMARSVAKSLPVGYELYVKENPAQISREWRKISEYKEIMEIPNVKLLHPSVSNEKLLENSSLVLTIAGSSGFEAAFYEKPSIVFSDVDYTLLPSVHRIKEIEKLPELIRTCLSEKVNPEDLDRFLTLLEKNTFDFDMRGLNTKILEHFFQGGYLLDTEISESQMKEFLADNKSLFEKLSLEYIKKINESKVIKTNEK
tara:strand:+ start:915 stop:2453 length:1539 start_codon:yes stop_codon:yes gene_type:complete